MRHVLRSNYGDFLSNVRTVFIDCDNTLVLWTSSKALQKRYKSLPSVLIIDPYITTRRVVYKLKKHTKHIEWLKRIAERGDEIVVWSAAGKQWCLAVVNALKLESYVSVCVGKPDTIYDDEKPEVWMPQKPRWEDPIS